MIKCTSNLLLLLINISVCLQPTQYANQEALLSQRHPAWRREGLFPESNLRATEETRVSQKTRPSAQPLLHFSGSPSIITAGDLPTSPMRRCTQSTCLQGPASVTVA